MHGLVYMQFIPVYFSGVQCFFLLHPSLDSPGASLYGDPILHNYVSNPRLRLAAAELGRYEVESCDAWPAMLQPGGLWWEAMRVGLKDKSSKSSKHWQF